VSTTSIEIADPNGEVIDVAAASTERLGLFCADLADHRERLADAERLVSEELVARLDRQALWTLRVGDPTGPRQFEIKAPSPDAGTEAYDPRLLEVELKTLLERNIIVEEAARAALERTLTITVAVPLDADLDAMEKAVRNAAGIEVAGVAVEPKSAVAGRSPKLGAISKLRKVAGTGAALDRAKLVPSPPARRAKVSVIARPAR
jgi:hypothetical protein